MKFNSVEKKISLLSVAIVVLSLVFVGGFTLLSSYNTAVKMAEDDLAGTAQITAERVKWEFEAYKNVLVGIGHVIELSSDTMTDEAKMSFMTEVCEQYGFNRGNVINSEGIGANGIDYSDRDYFKSAMNGEATISELMVAKSTGELSIIVAAPLLDLESKPVGCLYIVPEAEFLNDVMRSIKTSENALSYMVDREGYTIADTDSQLVLDRENCEAKAAEGDKNYAETAELHKLARSGEFGFYDFKENGTRYYAGYAPVGINDWAFITWCPASDYIGELNSSILISIVIVIVSIAISAVLSVLLGKRIGAPIKLCAERIKLLAHGDLTTPVPEIKSDDEIGVLAEAAQFTVSGMNNIIGDIERILKEMSDGNFDVNTTEHASYYIGDYEQILAYIKDINVKLSAALSQINNASDQTSSGSDQVSMGAQSLSQGATEQAASIEELAATINVIASKINESAASAEKASRKTSEAGAEMALANDKMKELVAAMQDISASSEETKKIIKTIEDIAFQTNILALNAAVEAARAGEAGKGFAVVADEVRNLAGKSAEAAKNTTSLIESTVAAIENGSSLVNDVADKMAGVSAAAGEVAAINAEITDGSKEIAASAAQITVGIDQISSVVQTNSATAEEAAAASEELSGQAAMLKELVSAFNLRDEDRNKVWDEE